MVHKPIPLLILYKRKSEEKLACIWVPVLMSLYERCCWMLCDSNVTYSFKLKVLEAELWTLFVLNISYQYFKAKTGTGDFNLMHSCVSNQH